MRRRDFLTAAAAASLTAACGGTPTATPRPSPSSPAALPPSPSPSPSPSPASAATMLARARVPALCYHQVRPWTAADSANARGFITPPSTLRAQLAAVRDAGYTTVSASQVVDHVELGTDLPPQPVLVCFDDASETHATAALPILQELGMTAAFFVMTVVLDKRDWLTSDQVRELDAAGMEVAAHTWDHQEVPTYSGDDWPVQLVEPRAQLEGIVGHPVDLFAYPYGLWDEEAFPHLRAAGYRAAFGLQQDPHPEHPLLTLRRVLVQPGLSGAQLLDVMRASF